MTKIIVTVSRSTEWLRKKWLEIGDNVPRVIYVNIDAAALSPRAREAVLTEYGYPSAFDGGYRGFQFLPPGCDRDGCIPLVIDSDAPTVEQIDAAIVAAAEALAAKRAQAEKMAEARQLLAEELTEARKRAEQAEAKLSEARKQRAEDLAEVRHALGQSEDNRRILSEFISFIPHDALRGAIKRMSDKQAPDAPALRRMINSAATFAVLPLE